MLFSEKKTSTARSDYDKYQRDVRLSVYVVYFFCIRDLVLFIMASFGVRIAYNSEMDMSTILALILLFMLGQGIKSYSMYSAVLMLLILSVDLMEGLLEFNLQFIVITLFWSMFIVRGLIAIYQLRRNKMLERSLVTHHIITNSIVSFLFLIFLIKQLFLS